MRSRQEAATARFLADRAASLQPLGLAEILLLGREHGAIDLAVGSPSFPGHREEFMELAYAALSERHNQYDDPAGNKELRKVIARLHGADADTEITVTAGATEGLNVVLQALVQPGDEVVVIEPFFEAYAPAVRLAGASPRFVPLSYPDWRWDSAELAAAFGPRTKAVIINSPHNPTGKVFDARELDEIARLSAAWGSVIISDEVYAEFHAAAEPGAPPPESARPARTVVLRSLSKSHALSGWRIGWIYAPADLTRSFRMVHEVLLVGCAAPLQVAAAGILDKWPHWSDGDRSALASKRLRLHQALTAANLKCGVPQGGAYLFPRLPPAAPPASELVRRLATECRFLAAPGGLFFADQKSGERYLRLAYNKSDEVLDVAIDVITIGVSRRIGAFM
jgi:N-succinyldiaminopimelate aminotransferase